MSHDWSGAEVEAVVDVYFDMLKLELAGQRYNKSEFRRQLLPRLVARSPGSVEFKNQNITAVLMKLGSPHIPGYQPMPNHQRLLFEVVANRLRQDSSFDNLALEAVQLAASDQKPGEPSWVKVDAPVPAPEVKDDSGRQFVPRKPVKRDYLEIESRNRSLGLAGEKFVVEYEQVRLDRAGRKDLAKRVDHASVTKGDGLGYDVLSYDRAGEELYIEVKTTAYGMYSPFFVSESELAFSGSSENQYRLYRLFNFRKRPQLFELSGPLGKCCNLDPCTYLARFR